MLLGTTKHYVYMRKDNEHLVSLNPEYGIEVSALTQLAESIKNDKKDQLR